MRRKWAESDDVGRLACSDQPTGHSCQGKGIREPYGGKPPYPVNWPGTDIDATKTILTTTGPWGNRRRRPRCHAASQGV